MSALCNSDGLIVHSPVVQVRPASRTSISRRRRTTRGWALRGSPRVESAEEPGPPPITSRNVLSACEHLDLMTTHDYLMVMKRVRIAQLKARLSEHVRDVRRGETYAVMDRETPVARLVPWSVEGEALRVRRPRGRYPSLQKVP